jgi:large subunit ribosomal protein L28
MVSRASSEHFATNSPKDFASKLHSTREETVAAAKESLDHFERRRQLTPLPARLMSKVCSITGAKPSRGSVIHRRGMAKKKGGVGRHVTKNVPRTFTPNLREQRIWVAELKKFVRVKVTARGLKTINKNGAYAALKKAGLITA